MKNLEIPNRIETQRLYLRPYQIGDGLMYFAASLRNREHLAEYESGNVLANLTDKAHAETVVQDLAADWAAGNHFFLGIFERGTNTWVGQIYVGPKDWELAEFFIGYVADVNHQGLGYITEAVKGVLQMLFNDLKAHRVLAECNQTNVRSWRLLERCGFKREDHLQKTRRNPDGRVQENILYRLLPEEFETSS